MIAKHKKRVNYYILTGLLLMLAGYVLGSVAGSAWQPVMWAVVILWYTGVVFWFAGLAYYAMAKGYTAWLALLGCLHLVGLLILVLLPDHGRERPEEQSDTRRQLEEMKRLTEMMESGTITYDEFRSLVRRLFAV